jgi:hypothetical protein
MMPPLVIDRDPRDPSVDRPFDDRLGHWWRSEFTILGQACYASPSASLSAAAARRSAPVSPA